MSHGQPGPGGWQPQPGQQPPGYPPQPGYLGQPGYPYPPVLFAAAFFSTGFNNNSWGPPSGAIVCLVLGLIATVLILLTPG